MSSMSAQMEARQQIKAQRHAQWVIDTRASRFVQDVLKHRGYAIRRYVGFDRKKHIVTVESAVKFKPLEPQGRINGQQGFIIDVWCGPKAGEKQFTVRFPELEKHDPEVTGDPMSFVKAFDRLLDDLKVQPREVELPSFPEDGTQPISPEEAMRLRQGQVELDEA